MEINNFDEIKSILKFPDNDTFYDLQIIRRGKDHPNMAAANRTIKSYYISDEKDLDRLKDEIIDMCQFFGARAYIYPQPRSIQKTVLFQIQYIGQRCCEGTFQKIWKSWATSSGSVKPKSSVWVIDIDEKDPIVVHDVAVEVNNLQPEGFKIISKIPTRNGFHLLTKPFRLDTFKKNHPDIGVHKNNPTVLYIPDDPSVSREERIAEAAKRTCKDKESAMKFLRSAGILDENGELNEIYR